MRFAVGRCYRRSASQSAWAVVAIGHIPETDVRRRGRDRDNVVASAVRGSIGLLSTTEMLRSDAAAFVKPRLLNEYFAIKMQWFHCLWRNVL